MSDERFPEVIPAPESHVWATLIPGRSPEFKVHRTEGLANAALGNRAVYESFAKYKLVEGVWTRVFLYEPGPRCDRCGNEFTKGAWGSGLSRNRDRTFKGPKFLAPVVCYKCDQHDYDEKRRLDQERRNRAEYERLQKIYGDS